MSNYRRQQATNHTSDLRTPGGWSVQDNACVPAQFYFPWDPELVAQLAQVSSVLDPNIFRSIPWPETTIYQKAYGRINMDSDSWEPKLKQAIDTVRQEESDRDGGWIETPMHFYCGRGHLIATVALERGTISIGNGRDIQVLALDSEAEPKDIYSLCVRKKHCKGNGHPGAILGIDMRGSTHFECPVKGCNFHGVYSSPVIIAECVKSLNNGSKDVYLTF